MLYDFLMNENHPKKTFIHRHFFRAVEKIGVLFLEYSYVLRKFYIKIRIQMNANLLTFVYYLVPQHEHCGGFLHSFGRGIRAGNFAKSNTKIKWNVHWMH